MNCVLNTIFFAHRKNYREVGLYWGGSIINSLIVLMIGGAVGKMSLHTFQFSFYMTLKKHITF